MYGKAKAYKLDTIIAAVAPEFAGVIQAKHFGTKRSTAHSSFTDCLKVLVLIHKLLWIFPAVKSFEELMLIQDM